MKRWRHHTLLSGFLLCCVWLFAKAAYLATEEHSFLQAEGDARSVRAESIRAQRGVLRDRHGEALAVSAPAYAVWFDPSEQALSQGDLNSLAAILELDPVEVTRKYADPARQFEFLRRRVSWERAARVAALALRGVYLQPEYRRYYPAGEVAAHIVGMTDIDDRGIEGVEAVLDETLGAVAGKKVVLKDRKGNTISDLAYEQPPRYGRDVALSIDLRLQFLAYRELKAAVTSHDAASASLVLADVDSGEILALVNQPSYNPNEPLSGIYSSMRNRAVTDVYEPGSTIKPFTAIAALETGKFHSNSLINTHPGYFSLRGKLIQDPVNRGTISLGDVLKKSSQVGIAKVALALEEHSVFDVLERAGFGRYVGSGLPGETVGALSERTLQNDLTRVTLAYGYGLSVSPLQLTQAYTTLAAYGEYRPLTILQRDRKPVGERVFDEAVVREVIEMMEGVTDADGTAPRAAVPGYRVAGKTGTARKVGAAGYDDERHVTLFAGMAPASHPRIVMVVVINEPRKGLSGGGSVAAPVFGRVAARALRMLGVAPDAPIPVQIAARGDV